MKASSLLKHIWIGCFICGLFLAATGIAFAGATNTGNNGKTDVCTQQEKAVKQHEQVSTQVAVITVPDHEKDNVKDKTAPKQAEIKKEEAGSGMFSFSFIYYLFYKTNFAESTNNAFKSSLKAFISRIID